MTEKNIANNEQYIYISVIVPVYNTKPYLERCLTSLTNQTLKNIEIICINDGSTDNSLEILKKYQEKDNRIKIIDQQNNGVSIARNNGIKAAKGKYIMFVDSDDYLDLNYLEIMYKKIDKDKPDIVLASQYLVENTINKGENVIELEEGKIFIIFCSNLYKKEFLKINKISFEPNIKNGEDAIFLLECNLKSNTIVRVNNKENNSFYHYVVRKNSATTNITENIENKFIGILKMTEIRLKLLKKYKDNFDNKTMENYLIRYIFYTIFRDFKYYRTYKNNYLIEKAYQTIEKLKNYIYELDPLSKYKKSYNEIFNIKTKEEFKSKIIKFCKNSLYNESDCEILYLFNKIKLLTIYKNQQFLKVKLFNLVDLFQIKSKNNKKYFRIFGIIFFSIVCNEKNIV